MGAYVNPPDTTKEQWLKQHGQPITGPPQRFDGLGTKFLPVCVVDNGHFTAAGIAFSQNELKVFADPNDPRPKKWYWVHIEDLLTVSNLKDYLS